MEGKRLFCSHLGLDRRELSNCFVGLLPYNKTNRDGFFDVISASVELKIISDRALPRLRQETYEIVSARPARLKLLLSSTTDNGTVSGAAIYGHANGR